MSHIQPLEPRRMLSLTFQGIETTVPGSEGADGYDLAVAGDGTFLLATDAEIFRYSRSGTQVGSPLSIPEVPESGADAVSVSADADGDAVVAFASSDSDSLAIHVSLISKDGMMSGPVKVTEWAFSGNEDESLSGISVSMDRSGGFFVGWIHTLTESLHDIEFRAFDADGTPRGSVVQAESISLPFSTVGQLDVAANPDGSGAAYAYFASFSDSLSNDVRFGRVSTTASIEGGTTAEPNADSPDIVVNEDGSFLLAYEKHPSAEEFVSETRSFVQRFDHDGNEVGDPLALGAALPGNGVHSPAVDSLPSGGFVVSFVHSVLNDDNTTATSTLYAREHLPNGQATGAGPMSIKNGTSDVFVSGDRFTPDPIFINPMVQASEDPSRLSVVSFIQDSAIHFQRVGSDFASLVGSDLYVLGTEAGETIDVFVNGTEAEVRRGSELQLFDVSDVTMLSIRGFGGDDTLINRTSFPATISGDDGNDTITGGLGKDKLRGLAGRDLISGGAGNDTIFGDDGNDSLFGNGGRDRIAGGLNGDYIRGNAGRDKLFGGGGNDRLLGGASGDRLFGGAHEDALNGEGGDDRMHGEEGEDTLRGGAADDFLFTRDLRIDQLFGDGGRDSADVDFDAVDTFQTIELLLE